MLARSKNRKMQLREIVKRIPGARRLYRSLISTPGSWLFNPENADWLKDRCNYADLPPVYKFFSIYFTHAPKTAHGKVLGAAWVHRAVSLLTRSLNLRSYSKVLVGDHVVYLNLLDPRSLVVPREIDGETKEDIRILGEFLSTGDTFVDVGANHGSFSIVASRLVGSDGMIVAVEPQPVLANLLERSLAANGVRQAEVHQFACAEKDGSGTLYIPRATSGRAGIFKDFSAISAFSAVKVDLKKFDNAVVWREFKGTVFVKLDVEGSEVGFLRGASEFITNKQPHIMLEINLESLGASRETDNVGNTLSELGYRYFREINDREPRPLQFLLGGGKNVIVLSPGYANLK